MFFFTLVLSAIIALAATTFVVRAVLPPPKSQAESMLVAWMRHPDEFLLLLQYLIGWRKITTQKPPQNLSEAQSYCYEILNRVSRSFAFVIMELPPVLRESICVFYLVLRGLDSVEDDMNIDVATKSKILTSFHLLFPVHEKKDDVSVQLRESLMELISTSNFGENDNERELLRKFSHVTETFQGLPVELRQCITGICKRMGAGMTEFLDKKVESVKDYELYCFYVAGLVGVGLSEIFVAAGFEDKAILGDDLMTEMGLFLQKTNISRDYREDIDQDPPRVFYPREIWSQYVAEVHDMKKEENEGVGVKCVNHMVWDALKHIEACLKYLSLLRQREVFRFCAIPQAMAIATLARCYNNPSVLKKVVKIRKGETLKMMRMESLDDAVDYFQTYVDEIRYKAKSCGDMRMMKRVDEAYDIIHKYRVVC